MLNHESHQKFVNMFIRKSQFTVTVPLAIQKLISQPHAVQLYPNYTR